MELKTWKSKDYDRTYPVIVVLYQVPGSTTLILYCSTTGTVLVSNIRDCTGIIVLINIEIPGLLSMLA